MSQERYERGGAGGWSEGEFELILEEVLRESGDSVVDISSPPGTRKTFNTLKYIVKRRLSAIAAFPTHTNQETALKYLLDIIEGHGGKPPFYVLDYAGIEHYCLLYDPDSLSRLLDHFRAGSQSYVDAALNFLSQDLVRSAVRERDVEVEEAWRIIGEALDHYAKTGDKRAYREAIKKLVGARGQREVCRLVCPVGILYNIYRKRVYKLLSKPKIITWRNVKVGGRVSRYIVHADPRSLAGEVVKAVRGRGFNLESILCPRLLLISKSVPGRRGRPNYIVVKRSVVLTPHSALDFVLDIARRAHRVQKLPFKHVLFIDEYDSFIRPHRVRVWSLDDLKALIDVANEVLEAGLDGRVGDYDVDVYLYRYASYVRNVATRVYNIIAESIESGVYHPLVNIVVEGALSRFREATLKTREEVVYKPLSPRPVHIKFFAGSDLLPLILNPSSYFREFEDYDDEWRVNMRIAAMKFASLARGRHAVKTLVVEGEPPLMEARLKRAYRTRSLHDFLEDLRSYLSPLLLAPRYAVYYAYDNGLWLVNLDRAIYYVLSTRRAILTSATPVAWDFLVRGPAMAGGVSAYTLLAGEALLSTVHIIRTARREYGDRVEQDFEARYQEYSGNDVAVAVEKGRALPAAGEIGVSRTRKRIRQISVHTSAALAYSRLLEVEYLNLPRLPQDGDPRVLRRPLSKYLDVALMLDGGVLLLVQNKEYAALIAEMLGATPCAGPACPAERRITHYQAGAMSVTWFRSRAGRGIDLPHDYKYVLVVGTPYPSPSYLTHTLNPPPLVTMLARMNRVEVQAYNEDERYIIAIGHTPRDVIASIAELAQALGRAARSAMKHGHNVKVILPRMLKRKIHFFAPTWLRLSA